MRLGSLGDRTTGKGFHALRPFAARSERGRPGILVESSETYAGYPSWHTRPAPFNHAWANGTRSTSLRTSTTSRRDRAQAQFPVSRRHETCFAYVKLEWMGPLVAGPPDASRRRPLESVTALFGLLSLVAVTGSAIYRPGGRAESTGRPACVEVALSSALARGSERISIGYRGLNES